MKNISEFISYLYSLEIKLWIEGDRLRYKIPKTKDSLMPTILAELAERKAEVIAFLNQANQATHSNLPPIQQVSRNKNLPLSFAQERLWFLEQLVPDNPAYNVPMAMRLVGSLNRIALVQSLMEIVRRHETLRTTFSMVDGKPVQVIQPLSIIHYPLSVVDLQDLSVPEQNLEVQQLATFESQRCFDLKCGPLFHITLLQLYSEEYVLLVTIHHIVTDGWSIGIFVKELSALYEAFSTGTTSPLPELSIQYADFAQWQRQWLSGELLETHKSYWKQQLTKAPPVLEIPSNYPRPPVNSFRGATEYFEISPALTQQLNSLTQRQPGVTLFMISLAAFAMLLERYSGGQKDIVIGSPIANRKHKEIEPLIGFFANTLALRLDLSGNPTFVELLKQVQKITLEAYAHQDLPFEQLVEILQPVRDMSRNPLIQVALAFQNAPMPPLVLKNLTLSWLKFESGIVRFDLEVHLWEASGKLLGHCYYYKDLFKATTIKRLLGHFQTLLAAIAENSKQPISEYSLLTEPERHQLLVEWNKTDSHYPRNKCIHHLFEAQVEQTPEAIAVLFEEQQLTYRELNTKANQLAHYLQTLGVKPEILVGICVERSLEMVIGLLGILKAGGSYVPFDPSYPHERLAFMLADTQVTILLTQEKFVHELSKLINSSVAKLQTRLLCLDTDWEVFSAPSTKTENLVNEVNSENLAYIMYTSGSTGWPKGISILHRGVVRLVKNVNYIQLTSKEIFLQFAPLSFDASTFEIWGCLLNGARLVIMPAHTPSLQELGLAIVHHKVTTLWLTANLFRLMVEERLADLRSVRQLLAGGDVLSTLHVEKVLQTITTCQVINGYGPTENTTFTCCYPMTAFKQWQKTVPIGRPIANTQVYILDSNLQPTPIGVPGELYVAGDGLARGYFNQPMLTGEKFIPNPFLENSQSRLYQSGDLVRYLPDGRIEYLTRIDNQVKVRGFRIELGEIEGTLSQHPLVREIVIICSEVQPDDKRLIAYVVPNFNDVAVCKSLEPDSNEIISQWQQVFEESYSHSDSHIEQAFNITGWNSSYTSLPLPEAEMHIWVNSTVDAILSLQPKRVLEIGCGTGLLLSRIAPHCQKYWATDYSKAVLQQVEDLKQTIDNLNHVVLLNQDARDFSHIAPEGFDTVIFNSVVQYFPSVTYLLEVLEQAIKVVKTGGHIFMGDIRHLPLLKAYHASVQFYQAPASLTRLELQQRMQQRLSQEEELVIDPNFFLVLKQHNPRITQVQIQPKRGDYHNELTRFRYEVILWVGDVSVQRTKGSEIKWQDWQSQKMTLSLFRQQLTTSQPELFGLRNIPNARLQTETKLLEWLANAEPTATVEQCRQLLEQSQPQGIDPQEIWQLTEELPYHVELSWASANPQGCYDVLFIHHSYKDHFVFPIPSEPLPKSWHDYANNPLQTKQNRKLVPQLRQYLQDKLPEYMVPSAFVMLEALPLTPNGKVDRKALVTPQTSQRTLEGKYLTPRNTVELQLTHIWETVLDLNPIGVQDNFFELGGHSLLAVRLMAKIEQQFGKNLPLATLFQTPTIEKLANLIRQSTDSQPWSPLVAIHQGGNRLPFFCIHPGGGNVLSYLELAHSLGTKQPFYALQSPGLNGQWELLASIEKMANYYIEALQTLQPQGPYQLGGWSFGGIVAFEMAQQLRQQGHEVALLALFDSYAPTLSNKMFEGITETMLITFFARNISHLFGKDLLISVDELPTGVNEQLKYLLKQAKNANILPPEMEVQYMQQLWQIFKANIQAMTRYKPQRYFGQTTLFRTSDTVVENAPSNGWEHFVAGGLEIHQIPGNHYAMMKKPQVLVLAEQLSTYLQ